MRTFCQILILLIFLCGCIANKSVFYYDNPDIIAIRDVEHHYENIQDIIATSINRGDTNTILLFSALLSLVYDRNAAIDFDGKVLPYEIFYASGYTNCGAYNAIANKVENIIGDDISGKRSEGRRTVKYPGRGWVTQDVVWVVGSLKDIYHAQIKKEYKYYREESVICEERLLFLKKSNDIWRIINEKRECRIGKRADQGQTIK